MFCYTHVNLFFPYWNKSKNRAITPNWYNFMQNSRFQGYQHFHYPIWMIEYWPGLLFSSVLNIPLAPHPPPPPPPRTHPGEGSFNSTSVLIGLWPQPEPGGRAQWLLLLHLSQDRERSPERVFCVLLLPHVFWTSSWFRARVWHQTNSHTFKALKTPASLLHRVCIQINTWVTLN